MTVDSHCLLRFQPSKPSKQVPESASALNADPASPLTSRVAARLGTSLSFAMANRRSLNATKRPAASAPIRPRSSNAALSSPWTPPIAGLRGVVRVWLPPRVSRYSTARMSVLGEHYRWG